jgi:hypothetical protein
MLALCPAYDACPSPEGERPAGALPFGPLRQQAQVAERVGGGLVGLL